MTRPEHPEGDEARSQDAPLESVDPPSGAGRTGHVSMARPAGRTVRTSQALTGGITSTARIPGPTGYFMADVPNRIVAMILDIILLAVIGFVLALLAGGLVSRPGALDSPGGELEVVAFLIVLALELGFSFLYFGYLWVALRGTLGMRLLGLQLGDEHDGHSIGWAQALIRWIIIGIPAVLVSMAVYVPGLVGLVASLVGLAWLALLLYSVARSATNQGVHDRFAHTVMLRQRRRSV